MKKKGPYDLEQRKIQRIYRENLANKDHLFFVVLISFFITGVLVLGLASFISNLAHPREVEEIITNKHEIKNPDHLEVDIYKEAED